MQRIKIPNVLKVFFVFIACLGIYPVSVLLWQSIPQNVQQVITEITDKVFIGIGIIIWIVIVAGVIYSVIKSVRLFRKNRENFYKRAKEVIEGFVAYLLFFGLMFVLFIIMGWMDDVFDFILKPFKELLHSI